MAKKATPHNTGLSIARNKNKFKVTWKIKAKDVKWQKIRYRTYNGKKWSKWHSKELGAKTTSYSFSLSAASTIKKIQVQMQTLRKPTSSYKESDWSSCSETYTVNKPPAPSLTTNKVSANQTTFSWSMSSSDTNHSWYRRCMYRTKYTKDPGSSSGWGAWTAATASSYTYTDTDLGKTRCFQIKAVGPAGSSASRTGKHYIGTASVATWIQKKPVSITKKASYYEMTYNVNLKGSTDNIDEVIPQYYIGSPDQYMACPGGASWTDGTSYSYTNSKNTYALAITTNDLIGDDECLWARVKTEHDSVPSYSAAYRVLTGKLAAPSTTISMGTPTPSGFTVSITVDDAGTAVPGAYAQVFLEKFSATGVENYILIGTIPNGSASATITSSIDLTAESGYSIHVRNVTADGKSMTSAYDSYTTTMPSAPTLNDVDSTTTTGKVYLSWTNNWSDATGIVVAWTDDPDNWMSNDDPETYEITEPASAWFITGLETGITWYFRVRAMKEEGDSVTYSPWSEEKSIDLSAAPAVPVLYLSEETITEDGMVTAYWSYVTTDGTSQVSGNIVEMTYSGGVWTVGDPVGTTTDAQHIDIYAKDHGWTNGSTVYLALQTRSGSGGLSDFSTPVQLDIAPTPTVAISTTSLATQETLTDYFIGDGVAVDFVCQSNPDALPTATVEGAAVTVSSYTDDTVTLAVAPDDGDEVAITYTTSDNNILDAMPLTATVTTTGSATLTMAIERAAAYPMDRPDGTHTDGAIGETVYVSTIPAEASNSISIELTELIGRLDDGALYNLVATVEDAYGQSVQAAPILFKVHWAHQAEAPTATFVTDTINYVVQITPVAPAGYQLGDTCDIYRLGADQPELIYSGAEFGTTYVDPYPAFGAYSGYDVVTVTAAADYITEENTFAEFNTMENAGAYTQLDPLTMVIDYDGERVELPYELTLGNTWTKDFKRTVYLGGHVAGDHNRAVTRDLSASTVLVRADDEETAIDMRELARYAGICHVRTPEGSSFAADVQVNENRAFNSSRLEYTLTIQKVDTEGFDGMTLADWSDAQ